MVDLTNSSPTPGNSYPGPRSPPNRPVRPMSTRRQHPARWISSRRTRRTGHRRRLAWLHHGIDPANWARLLALADKAPAGPSCAANSSPLSPFYSREDAKCPAENAPGWRQPIERAIPCDRLTRPRRSSPRGARLQPGVLQLPQFDSENQISI